MGSFYPHGKPSFYSYTEHFMDVGNDVVGAAYANTQYPGLDGRQGGEVTKRAIGNLQTLINAARAAETAFLNDTGLNLKDPSAADVFRHMNKIFNSRETFQRGLEYMKSIASANGDMKKEQMYRDVSRYFGTYLTQVIREEVKGFTKKDLLQKSPAAIESLINDIISKALIRTYERVQDFIGPNGEIRGKFGNKTRPRKNEQEVQAIKDMIQTIKELQSVGAFGKYGNLFNLDFNSLQEIAGNKRDRVFLNKKKFNDAHVDANFGGNILELITSVVAAKIGNTNISNNGLQIVGVHTGQMNQMKADTMLFVGTGKVNVQDYLQYVNSSFGSVRMQNISAIDQYLRKLEDNLKHVIMISDKNYSIKANFGGVNAQEKMDLASAKGMLARFRVGQVTELINYLANCGDKMVQGDVNGEVRTELQSLIAYFLFDHLEIQVSGPKPGPNVVNLLNISGIYIPLSTYLEGILNSIKEVTSNPSSFVSVSISLGGETEQPKWTSGNWAAFRKSHETQSFISYRILKNIASFISSL